MSVKHERPLSHYARHRVAASELRSLSGHRQREMIALRGRKLHSLHSYRTSVSVVLRSVVIRLCNLIDDNRLGAFSFLVVIADATGMGLFAFLAELGSHFSTSSKLKLTATASGLELPDAT